MPVAISDAVITPAEILPAITEFAASKEDVMFPAAISVDVIAAAAILPAITDPAASSVAVIVPAAITGVPEPVIKLLYVVQAPLTLMYKLLL